MIPSNFITVGPNPLKQFVILVFGCIGTLGGVMLTVYGLSRISLGIFGQDWFLSSKWIIIVVTEALIVCGLGGLFLVSCIGGKPRVEIGTDGFIVHYVLKSRSRRWSDIEGNFVVIQVGWNKSVGYRLSQEFKESAGIKPNKLYGGNDEVVFGVYAVSIEKLAELLNHHKTHGVSVS